VTGPYAQRWTRTDMLDLAAVCDTVAAAEELVRAMLALPYGRPSRVIVARLRDGSSEPRSDVRRLPGGTELVTLTAGDGGEGLPSMVAALRRSDLPLALLWWSSREPWRDRLLAPLIDHAARVFVDSTREPGLLDALRAAPSRTGDLSWTRIAGWREAVARAFDAPVDAAALDVLEGIELRHAAGPVAQARLLAAWITSRTPVRPRVRLVPEFGTAAAPGSLLAVRLTFPGDRALVERLVDGALRVTSPGIPHQYLRLGPDALADLLARELQVLGRDADLEDALQGL
jgi:glucose-6-phosphate dehydrogenase assembly protein OpcA